MKNAAAKRRWYHAGVLATSLLVGASMCLLLVMESSAQSRDPDGTRMQARKVDVGSTHSATLSPPVDVVDWRYIQLGAAASVTIEVNVEPVDATARVVLTSASGDELQASNSRSGRLALSRSLDPGIYYISIQSGVALRYQMSIR